MKEGVFPTSIRYLICLTIGPAFLSGAIYLCLARIVVVYCEGISRFSPRTYTITFMTFDFISLLLQAIGGAIASTSNTKSGKQTGINIMIAGLSWQVVSLVVFIVLCSEYAWRVYKRTGGLEPGFEPLRQTRLFQGFLWALGLATIFILVRSSFRVAELSQGFNGALANDEITFMILEGVMIILACTALTVFHPGPSFAGMWAEANFKLRAKKSKNVPRDGSLEEVYEQDKNRQHL